MAKIILLDDQQYALRFFQYELQTAGHQVLTVSTAAELIAKIAAYKPQVVILEIKRDSGDGSSLINQIKKRNGSISVIAWTHPDSGRSERLLPAAHYVTKSFDTTELKEKINQVERFGMTQTCLDAGEST